MLSLGLTGTIHLAIEPVDGRKGIDGLAGVVRASLGRDPTSGDLFVFRNRRGGSLKILAGMGDGFALYLRRLEQGTFAFPTTNSNSSELVINSTQLAMILGGVEPADTRTRRRYQKSPGNPGPS